MGWAQWCPVLTAIPNLSRIVPKSYGWIDLILKDITAVLFSDWPYIFRPSILSSSEVAYLSSESSYSAIASYPILLIYSTA